MSESKNVVNKKASFRIIPRIPKATKNLGKYMEPQQNVREELSPNELQLKINDVLKQVTGLSALAARRLFQVDWLQNWDSFEIRSDATLDEIPGIQRNIETWVRGLLADYVANSKGIMYTIAEFVWVPGNNDHEFTLAAYLNPPAQTVGAGINTEERIQGAGAAPVQAGNISPMPPTQPPPPSF